MDAFWFLMSEYEVLVGIYVGCMLIAHSLWLLQFAQLVYSKVNRLPQTTESNFQLSSFIQHLLGKEKTFWFHLGQVLKKLLKTLDSHSPKHSVEVVFVFFTRVSDKTPAAGIADGVWGSWPSAKVKSTKRFFLISFPNMARILSKTYCCVGVSLGLPAWPMKQMASTWSMPAEPFAWTNQRICSVLNFSWISKAQSVHDSEVVRYFESFHVR